MGLALALALIMLPVPARADAPVRVTCLLADGGAVAEGTRYALVHVCLRNETDRPISFVRLRVSGDDGPGTITFSATFPPNAVTIETVTDRRFTSADPIEVHYADGSVWRADW